MICFGIGRKVTEQEPAASGAAQVQLTQENTPRAYRFVSALGSIGSNSNSKEKTEDDRHRKTGNA